MVKPQKLETFDRTECAQARDRVRAPAPPALGRVESMTAELFLMRAALERERRRSVDLEHTCGRLEVELTALRTSDAPARHAADRLDAASDGCEG